MPLYIWNILYSYKNPSLEILSNAHGRWSLVIWQDITNWYPTIVRAMHVLTSNMRKHVLSPSALILVMSLFFKFHVFPHMCSVFPIFTPYLLLICKNCLLFLNFNPCADFCLVCGFLQILCTGWKFLLLLS